MAFYEVSRQGNLGEVLQEPNRKMPVKLPEPIGESATWSSTADRRSRSGEVDLGHRNTY